MRHGVVRLILGLLLLGGGLAATFLMDGVYWWGAIAVGAYYIIHGIVIMVRASRIGG
ncbi:MAG TPA: hypothetical protein VF407_00555 [Polyangiaceae bacterium]